tara:strand:+ start:2458 stop:3267 length:810 start_codon:yes stop_codon:yes gene_type:complete
MALKYHPDKNKDENAEDHFKNIGSSYTFLSRHLDSNFIEEETSSEYSDVLDSFVKFFSGGKTDEDYSSVIFDIISKIKMKCNDDTVLELCREIDINTLVDVYEFVKKYETFLYLEISLVDKIKEYIDSQRGDNVYIVNPSIDDLFDNNIYKLLRGEKTIYVPMWHSELVYEFDKEELTVKCIPNLPDHINIDERNNMHVYLKRKFDGLLHMPNIQFNLGKNTFQIELSDLHIMKYQTITIRDKGISLINESNVYDDSKRSHIIIHLEFI